MSTIAEMLALARQNQQSGALPEARSLYRRILASDPRCTAAWRSLGKMALSAGNAAEAVELIAKAVALAPDEGMSRFDLGVAYESLGKSENAAACFTAAVRLCPYLAEAHHNLAVCYRRLGNLAGAQEHCRLALQLKSDYPDAWNHQGLIWLELKRFDDALAAVETAIQLDPHHSSAHNHRAVALHLMGRSDDAIESYRKAIALNPNFAHAHSNIAALLQEQGKLDEAESHLRLALQLDSAFAVARTNLAAVLQLQGKIDEATENFRLAASLAPGDATLASNYLFCLNYDSRIDSPALLAEHRRWGNVFGRAAVLGPSGHIDRDPDRPLRVGYVSPDFHDHPLTQFFEPVLAHHHPASVLAFCFSNVVRSDAVTARLRSLASEWRAIESLSDADAANQIRADRIDILVDLAGHTAAGRLTMFSRRPAPIQVSWLGYPNTTGLSAIDYYLTDDQADPPGAESNFVEKLIRLPRGFACYAPPPDAPPVGPLPARRNGFITFGSLHGLARLNDDVIDTWCLILKLIPTSRLLIFRNTLRGKVREELFHYITRQGIAPNRFDLFNSLHGPGGYLGVHHHIDVSLDTFPWSGHTTACQSLWMGVPVISFAGARHAGRMAASALHQIGLDHFIANSRERYVGTAVKTAADIGALAALRMALRPRMLASPLCDSAGFTVSLEHAYRKMWHDFIRHGKVEVAGAS
ncbi:MAG TPA: tetratricopeptide repeat protein [Tepidisphaeraceae bacterium]|jgi:predicted O-linked N-acetylglucosamine transferase (SPINDLY family)|nr:tetratricopeptide repeat protein [Tepidisphaeraceae bacterium]